MIKELKNVIEVVDDLKASNLVNVQILKKALTDINGRLEEISDGDELMFIRNSIAQFKEALDFKFSNIMERIKSRQPLRFHWFRSILKTPAWYAQLQDELNSLDENVVILDAPSFFELMRIALKDGTY